MSPTESIPLMRRYDMGTLWSSRLEISVGSCVARVKRKRGEAKTLPNAGGTAGNIWKFLVPDFGLCATGHGSEFRGFFYFNLYKVSFLGGWSGLRSDCRSGLV